MFVLLNLDVATLPISKNWACQFELDGFWSFVRVFCFFFFSFFHLKCRTKYQIGDSYYLFYIENKSSNGNAHEFQLWECLCMYVCGGIFFSLLYFGSRWRLEMFPKQKVDLKLWTFQESLMLYHTVSFFLEHEFECALRLDESSTTITHTDTVAFEKCLLFQKAYTSK